jgi:hypothetical protein
MIAASCADFIPNGSAKFSAAPELPGAQNGYKLVLGFIYHLPCSVRVNPITALEPVLSNAFAPRQLATTR